MLIFDLEKLIKIIVTQHMYYNIREMTIGDYEEALTLIIDY